MAISKPTGLKNRAGIAVQGTWRYFNHFLSLSFRSTIKKSLSISNSVFTFNGARFISLYLHLFLCHIKQDLPPHIRERLCHWCTALQIPGITSRIRLRSRSKRSKANKAQSKRMKNEMVYTCLVCNRVSKRESVYRASKPQTPVKVTAPPAPMASSSTKGKASKFSFKDSMPSGMKSDIGRLDFVPLTSSSTSQTGKRRVNLLELEQMNKKKKRKSIGTETSQQPRGNTTTQAAGLGSLKAMLSTGKKI